MVNNEKLNHIPLILLTADTTTETRLKAFDTGAIDIMHKPFSFHELQQKIKTVLSTMEKQKVAFINTYIAQNNFSQGGGQVGSKSEDDILSMYGLTERERSLVELLKIGYTYERIGEILYISDKTAKKHAQNIFRKVGATNKIDLIQKLNP